MLKKGLLCVLAFALAALCRAGTFTDTIDSDFYGGSLNGMAVSGTGAGATLTLRSALYPLQGDSFVTDGTNDYTIYNSGERLAMPFSVPRHMTVTAVVIYTQWAGTAASYECGIRADAAGGTLPVMSGWLAAGCHNTITNALADTNPYYMRVTFTADAVLDAGVPYHVCFDPGSGYDASNNIKLRSTTPNNLFYATDGSADAYQSVLQSINSGASWTVNSGAQPVFLLEYLDPAGDHTDAQGRSVSYIGNPYNAAADMQVYGSNFAGQEFEIKTPASVSKVRVYVRYSGGTPSDALYIVIQDVTDPGNVTALADEMFCAGSAVFSGFAWVNHNLNSAQNLQAGHSYRIFLKSTGSSAGAHYLLKGASVYRNALQDTVFPGAAVASSTSGGAGSRMVYTTGAGTSWDDYGATRDLLMCMDDSYSLLYDTSGMFWSAAFDAGSASTFTNLSWSPVTQPASAGTGSVMVQLAANNDNATWDYAGPDGTSATWFTDGSGNALSGIFGNKRYIRYRMSMSTWDRTVSPAVGSLSIIYEARPGSGEGIGLTNYPNPFRPGTEKTVIRYTLYGDSDVTVSITTPFMGPVRKYVIASGGEGAHGTAGGYENRVEWDGRNGEGLAVESGVYICTVTVKDGNRTYARKIAVLK